MSTMTKRPTIRDVAAEAGVSKSLVSLAYSSPNSVSDKRKEKILKAAEKLGYAPNFLARSLAADSGTFIAILIADLHNPLFVEIADQVRARLEGEGRFYYITSAMIRNEDGVPYLDKQTLKSIIDLRPESLLVIGSIPKIELLEELPKNLPIIIASGVPIGIPRAQTVRSDETVAMRLVVDHLVELGHKNIAHISGVTNVVAKERAAGYENAMKENGLSKNINIAQAKTDDEVAGFAMTEKLLKSDNPPTAIACFNDLQAIGAQDAIIKMKANVALVGYDNTYLSSLEQINLTTVDPGNREIADKCADLLLSDELSSHFIHTSTPTLVVRNSTTKVKK
jgi:DNA-binding LacI/PurR family transcriptional regulator